MPWNLRLYDKFYKIPLNVKYIINYHSNICIFSTIHTRNVKSLSSHLKWVSKSCLFHLICISQICHHLFVISTSIILIILWKDCSKLNILLTSILIYLKIIAHPPARVINLKHNPKEIKAPFLSQQSLNSRSRIIRSLVIWTQLHLLLLLILWA